MLQIETLRGSIYYTEELIRNIVALSTMECYGVVGMAKRNVQEGMWELLRNNINKGVKIELDNEKLNATVFVIVKYGIKVSIIANSIIQKIKYNIENHAGLSINSITVNIQGVKI